MKKLEKIKMHKNLYGLGVTILATAILEIVGSVLTPELTSLLIILAGFAGGYIMGKIGRGLIIASIGVMVTWSLFYAVYYLWRPHNFSLLLQVMGQFLAFSLILGGAIGAIGGVLGAVVHDMQASSRDRLVSIRRK